MHDLADFFDLRFGHDALQFGLVVAKGWVVDEKRFELCAKGFSPTAFVRAEAVALKG